MQAPSVALEALSFFSIGFLFPSSGFVRGTSPFNETSTRGSFPSPPCFRPRGSVLFDLSHPGGAAQGMEGRPSVHSMLGEDLRPVCRASARAGGGRIDAKEGTPSWTSRHKPDGVCGTTWVQATTAMEKAPKWRLMHKVNERTVPLKMPNGSQAAWAGVCVVSVAAMRGVLLHTAKNLDKTTKVAWHGDGMTNKREIEDEKDPLGIAKDLKDWYPAESNENLESTEASNTEGRRNVEGETTQRVEEWWVSLPVIYVATMDDPKNGLRGPYSINMTPYGQPNFHAVCFEHMQDAKNFMYLASTLPEFTEKRPGVRPESPRKFKKLSEEENFKVVVFRRGVLDLRPGVKEEELYVQMVEKGGNDEWGDLMEHSMLKAK